MTAELKAKWDAACERLHNAEQAHKAAESETEYNRTLEELRQAGLHKIAVEREISQPQS